MYHYGWFNKFLTSFLTIIFPRMKYHGLASAFPMNVDLYRSNICNLKMLKIQNFLMLAMTVPVENSTADLKCEVIVKIQENCKCYINQCWPKGLAV